MELAKVIGNNLKQARKYKGLTQREVAEKFNVPLYCGEYGVIDQADCHDAVKWLADINQALDELNLARAIWTYKNKDFGLVDEHYAPVLDQVVKYL